MMAFIFYFIFQQMSEVVVRELEKERLEFGKNFDYVLRDPQCNTLPPGTRTFWLIGRQTKEGLQEIKKRPKSAQKTL